MSTVTETATLDRAELVRRQAELKALQQSLTEQELELSTLHNELQIFENVYNRIMGERQNELERLKKRVLDFAAGFDSSGSQTVSDQQKNFEKDWENFSFDESEETDDTGSADIFGEGDPFTPDETLKKLFREAARKFHPDLTTDTEEREKRHDLMARLNAAYLEMDSEKIRALIDEGEANFPEEDKSHSVRQQLSRVLKQTGQVRHRLLQIEKKIEQLRNSDMARLKTYCNKGETEGRDVLQEMADEAQEKIDSLKMRVARLASDCSIL
ncbi:MAG: hypothetical protein G3M70_10435 [Candidatus Nitronauta litoralis]|uniref:J domain-containing protein n=1 Tax=Candidatus Nitronauta litoralis TaxID=2705533 RepID=A0A7T0G0G1_9BACT|nr:MAG: hypothetical protein G3M70_10435 [Candidatus Nitronauta litoralis]